LKTPQIYESEMIWKEAISKLSLEEKALVKRKAEFILNEVLAQNRSISLEHKRQMEFKSDKFRKRFDLREQDPSKINNFFVRAHIIKLRKDTEEGEINRRVNLVDTNADV